MLVLIFYQCLEVDQSVILVVSETTDRTDERLRRASVV